MIPPLCIWILSLLISLPPPSQEDLFKELDGEGQQQEDPSTPDSDLFDLGKEGDRITFLEDEICDLFHELREKEKRRKTRIGARIKTLNRHRRVKEMLPSLPKTRLKLVRSSGQSSVDTGFSWTFLLNVRMNMHSFRYGILLTNPIGTFNSRDQTS